MDLSGKTLVLYDGVCGLCNRTNRLLLFADRHDRLRFAALQSPFAADVLSRHGIIPADLDSVIVLTDFRGPQEKAHVRSDAVLELARVLGGIWRFAALFRLIPGSLLDRLYRWIAGNRYRIFGRYQSCPTPRPEHSAKFIAEGGVNH